MRSREHLRRGQLVVIPISGREQADDVERRLDSASSDAKVGESTVLERDVLDAVAKDPIELSRVDR